MKRLPLILVALLLAHSASARVVLVEKAEKPRSTLMLLASNDPPATDTAQVRVSNAWIRFLPAGLPAAGYFSLRNMGENPLNLTAVASPACGTLMLHRSMTMGGMTSMEHVMSLTIPAGGSVDFEPAGYHLMCENPKPELKIGAEVPVTLQFSDGSTATAQFPVRNAAGK